MTDLVNPDDGMDPNEGMNEDEIFDSIVGESNGVITIIFESNEDISPRVDLGEIHPFAAIVVLESVIEALKLLVPDPEITYDDRLIFKTTYLTAEGEEEDD